MAALSNYFENVLIDELFRGIAYTPPASFHIGLLTAAPSDTGGGTEVSGGSYARVAVVRGTSTWTNTQNSGTGASSGTSGTTTNAGAITFPTPTAAWGTVTHVGIYDAATGGNLLVYAPLTISKAVSSGDVVQFQANQLSFQIDD